MCVAVACEWSWITTQHPSRDINQNGFVHKHVLTEHDQIWQFVCAHELQYMRSRLDISDMTGWQTFLGWLITTNQMSP